MSAALEDAASAMIWQAQHWLDHPALRGDERLTHHWRGLQAGLIVLLQTSGFLVLAAANRSADEGQRQLVAARAALPPGFKDFSGAQVREFLAVHGFEAAPDQVANLQRYLLAGRHENRPLTSAVEFHHEHPIAAIDGDDGAGADAASVAARQGGAQ